MKKIRKIGAAMIMSMVLLIPQGVMAEEVNNEVEPEIEEYVNVLSVSATLNISAGTAQCTGKNQMVKNHDSKITMTLQKSTDKSNYSKVASWSQTYAGTGMKTLTKSKDVTKGYYYRVKVVVRVYDGGEVVEKITTYSSVVKY